MAIAGDKPETGVRISVERAKNSDPPWTYSGEATLPERSHPIRVIVTPEGEVTVEGDDLPAGLGEKARLIVRTVWKQAKADGVPPPWRIVRWRAEK